MSEFDKVIEMYPPKGREAQLIIDHFLKGKSIVGDIDIGDTEAVFR